MDHAGTTRIVESITLLIAGSVAIVGVHLAPSAFRPSGRGGAGVGAPCGQELDWEI